MAENWRMAIPLSEGEPVPGGIRPGPGTGHTPSRLTPFQYRLIGFKSEFEAARKLLTEREFLSLMDIVRRQVEHELGEDE